MPGNELRVGILSLEHFGTHEADAQKPLRDQCAFKHKQIPTTRKTMFSIMKKQPAGLVNSILESEQDSQLSLHR